MKAAVKYYLIIAIISSTSTILNAQSITSIDPNNGQQGQSLWVTITGQDTTFLQASATTITAVWFDQGTGMVSASSFGASSPTSASASFNIPGGASTGSWDFEVSNTVDGTLTLPNGFTVNASPPILISIAPDNAEQAESLSVTITGHNTTFLQGSSTTITNVWFAQGSSTINASSFGASSPTFASANFDIPGGASIGSWDFKVSDTVDGTLTLPSGFTVTSSSARLISIAPDNAEQGESLSVTITGQDTIFGQGSSTTVTSVWFSQGSPTVSIDASSFVASSDTSLSAGFDIPINATSGTWDVHVDNTVDGQLTVEDGFTIYGYPDLNVDGKVDLKDFAFFSRHYLE